MILGSESLFLLFVHQLSLVRFFSFSRPVEANQIEPMNVLCVRIFFASALTLLAHATSPTYGNGSKGNLHRE